MGNFEIQRALSEYQQAEATANQVYQNTSTAQSNAATLIKP
jgi:hypothetical protein